MSIEVLDMVVAALRDTSEKTTAEIVEERKTMEPGPYGIQPGVYTDRRDKYSRDWIAGRLLGMAEMIEAVAHGGGAGPLKPGD